MVEQPAAGPEQLVQPASVDVDLLDAHVLDHPDAGDRVERAVGHLAVVGDADLDAVGHAGLARPLGRQLRLIARTSVIPTARTPWRVAAWITKLPHPQPTSSTRSPSRRRELLADQLDLGLLGLLQRLAPRPKVRAAVGHRTVQEQREEVVADVVVVSHRAAVPGDRVPLSAEP